MGHLNLNPVLKFRILVSARRWLPNLPRSEATEECGDSTTPILLLEAVIILTPEEILMELLAVMPW